MPSEGGQRGGSGRSPQPAGGEDKTVTWRDGLLLGLLAVVDLVVFSSVLSGTMPPWSICFRVIGFVPLAWRRTAPLLVFGLVWAHLVVAVVLTPDSIPTVALLVGLYGVAADRSLRASLTALALAYLVYAPATTAAELRDSSTADGRAATAGIFAFLALLLGAAWALGRWRRLSRARLDALEQRRVRAGAEAVAAERSRIARELHDIVSQSVSLMVLQAGGAKTVLDRDPERARQALAHIEAVGKQSMGELRRLLGVLRDGAFVEDPAHGAMGPAPGLADLPALIESFRAGGLAARSEVQGEPLRLDSSVDLSAYRIVAESLTNASKHAGPEAVVTVRQMWAADTFVLEVTDEGMDAVTDPELSTGHGLLGMRERARAVGGRLEAGAVTGGGFRVSATLPVTEDAAATVMATQAPS